MAACSHDPDDQKMLVWIGLGPNLTFLGLVALISEPLLGISIVTLAL